MKISLVRLRLEVERYYSLASDGLAVPAGRLKSPEHGGLDGTVIQQFAALARCVYSLGADDLARGVNNYFHRNGDAL